MANTFELIEAITVGSGGAASIDFTSIPSTFTDLALKVSVRDDRSGYAVNNLIVKFNNTSTTYTGKQIYYANSSSPASSNNYNGSVPSPVDTANVFSSSEIYIPNYTSSNQKSFSIDDATEGISTYFSIGFSAGLWNGTGAINQITLSAQSANFVQYSTAYLYGVKNA
jgi:hypothetical protein